MKDVNLLAMKTIEKELGVEIGYSDHTLGIEIPIAAVTLGATVIEKHFTIDKTMEGPDHKASLEPNELKAMVAGIRAIELAMGNGIKTPSESEQKNIKVARKSLVALTDIKEGEVFNESNITVKRPGTGISPMKWNEVLGSRASRNYKADELL
jgi:N,N'-diacetyllegionaminate synthase